jgi:phage tail-like protein
MLDSEFQVQTLDTLEQWKSGLAVGLNVDASGLSLFATPSFETWLDRSAAGGDIVTDECGQTWWIALDAATSHWTLFRNNPRTKETERVIELHDCDDIQPRKLWLTRDYLLIFDECNARILGLSRDNYQILVEVQAGDGELIDIDFDRASTFQALMKHGEKFMLCGLPLPPAYSSDRQCVPLKDAVKAVTIAVSPNGWSYILDAGLGRFLRLRPGDEKPEQLAAASGNILKYFKPSVFEIDSRSVLFLVGFPIFSQDNVKDFSAFAANLKKRGDAVSIYITDRFTDDTRESLATWSEPAAVPASLREALVDEILAIVQGPSIWDQGRFAKVSLRPEVLDLAARNPQGADLARLNLLLLEDAYSRDLPKRLKLYPKLYQFDANGSRIGETILPPDIEAVTGIGFDEGAVYIATDRGLARFALSITPVGQSGVYYGRALDNGESEGLWHRFEFTGTLPPKTSVEVSYYTSGETALKVAHDEVLDSNDSIEQKQDKIEKLLRPLWNRPGMRAGTKEEEPGEVFQGSRLSEEAISQPAGSPHDMLFLYNKGRFLYLKLVLTTFDERNRPLVRKARIFYPRKSYLRYLPPVYSEDPVAAAFLERFLSLFETVFQGLDEEITKLFRYFDPQLAPREFLPWLASWINLAIDENLPEDRIQRLIGSAPDLFSRKGTPLALATFLEIYTGKPVLLIEHSRMIRPLVLGGDLMLGRGTILVGSGPNVFRLGDTSILGRAVLRSQEPAPEEAFLPFVRRFSIFLDLDREEFRQREAVLRRIVDEQTPAHTICSLGIISTHNRVGTAQLGINSTVTGPKPYRVGLSRLGEGSAITKGPPAPRIERGARFGGKERI